MSEGCSSTPGQARPTPCCAAAASTGPTGPLSWFENMIPRCLEYAQAGHAQGRPIVGILCEYTPRELILAAGAIPVCLCGGSQDTIATAEHDLPANLCPLIKSTYGYHVERSNPFLEMASLIVAETTCDGKKKMYELMAETRPMHVLELPQKPNRAEGLAFWENQLRAFQSVLEARFGVEITKDKLRAAIETMNEERRLRRELAALMKRDKPPITGRQLLQIKSSISGIPADLAQYRQLLEELSALDNGCGTEHGPVRVLMTGVPMAHGSERVLEIIEHCGGLVVCLENCTGIKPIIEDVALDDPDPIHALAEKYYHLPCSVMSPNTGRLDLLRSLAEAYRADCVIELVWRACLTYDVESRQVKRVVEEDLALPYLHIETDYAPSDSARVAVRVEALFETTRQRKQQAEAQTK